MPRILTVFGFVLLLSIKLGDDAKSFELNELDVEKTNVTIGFSFGTMAVRDVRITP